MVLFYIITLSKVHFVEFFSCPPIQILKLIFIHVPYTVELWFTNKFSEQKTSRMTNSVSDYEHASRQQRQAESIGARVSVAG
jgi:hypothetical protein